MNEINFLPDLRIREQQRQKRLFRQATLIVLTVVGMAVWWFTTRHAVADLDQYARALQSEASNVRTQANEVTEMQQQLDVLSHQVHMQYELSPGLGYTQILATLAELMPASLTLTELHADTSLPALSKPKKRGRRKMPKFKQKQKPQKPEAKQPERIKLSLEGVGLEDEAVANFVGKLAEHPLFDKVNLLYTRASTTRDVPTRSYRIEMEVPLDADYKPAADEEENRAARP